MKSSYQIYQPYGRNQNEDSLIITEEDNQLNDN